MKYVLAAVLAASWISSASAAQARSWHFDCGEHHVHVGVYRENGEIARFAITIDRVNAHQRFAETPAFRWDTEKDDGAPDAATLGGRPCMEETGD